MKIIKPYYEIMDNIDGQSVLKKIEQCGRVCYKSEEKMTDKSSSGFVSAIIKRGHESVLEHFSFTVRFVCDRGISHEIVRHRLASFSQESTRYCNYSKKGFDSEIVVIEPCFFEKGTQEYLSWYSGCCTAEEEYFNLLKNCSPQEARSVLPNSLKTEIIMTANLREWRHFLRLRTAISAHPQIREITIPLLEELKQRIPIVFADILSEVK